MTTISENYFGFISIISFEINEKKIIKYVQLRHLQWPVCRGVALGTAGKGRVVPTSVSVTACRTTNSCQYLNSVVLPQLKQFQT